MNSTVHNVQRVTQLVMAEGDGLVQALMDEMQDVAQEMVRLLKLRAPTFRGNLRHVVRADRRDPERWQVGAYAPYAQAVEEGRGPGKSLPRWSDPAAADIKAWLTSKVFKGRKRARKGTMGVVREDLELRDRYQGLVWHVRRKGLKAHPFFRPTAEQISRVFPQRMAEVGRVFLARHGAGGEGTLS